MFSDCGRYVFSVLACMGNMICLLGRDSMRLAIIPMKNETQMSPEEVSHILGGYNYGMVLTMLAGGPLADTLGGKWLLLLVTLLSSTCTLLVPMLATWSPAAVATCQVVSGLAGGLVVPALSSMIARWEPVTETGKLATIIFTGSQFSAVFTSLFTGYMCYNYTWQLVFYILGSVPLLWIIPWVTLVTDNPTRSKLTSEREREMLRQETISCVSRPRLQHIPLVRILSSPAVLAVLVANVGVTWAGTHTALLLPQYLHSSLQLPLHTNSLISALPYIGSCLCGLLSSYIYNSLLHCNISRSSARKICSSLCLCGFAFLTLPVPFISHSTTLVTILTTSAYALTGFNLVGAWSNPIDIAPNFVGTIMGISGLFSYITGALVPHTYSLMANFVTSLNKDNVIHETEEKEHLVWTLLFVLVSVVCILTNFVFLILGTAERQTWNRLEDGESTETLDRSNDTLQKQIICDKNFNKIDNHSLGDDEQDIVKLLL